MNDINEPFLNRNADFSPYRDMAFDLSAMARKDRAVNGDKVINATLGSFFGEDGKILTFKTVYDSFDRVPAGDKARYASDIIGNPDFREEIFNWINRKNNISLPHTVIAAPGGTGALYLMFASCLEKGQTLLIPDIFWGSYNLMAKKENLRLEHYSLINENNEVTIEDIRKKAAELMELQGKVLVLINDPCHNPTGITLGKEKWQQLITFFNELSEKGPVIVVNDVAYLDFGYDIENVTDYMSCFNEISENVLIATAYSCSKSFTSYGVRLGANILLSRNQETLNHMEAALKRTCRSCWSNVNNGFMHCFVDVMKNHREEYIKEKNEAVRLLQKRSQLIMEEARSCGLPIYPYSEGFFITIHIEDPDLLNRYHNALIASHIYTVRFRKGVRIAVCGLPLSKCKGLALRMNQIYQEVLND